VTLLRYSAAFVDKRLPKANITELSQTSQHCVLCQRLVSQFASGTFKCSQIGTSKAELDTDQRHADLTLGAARQLDQGVRRYAGMLMKHVTFLASGGNRDSAIGRKMRTTCVENQRLLHSALGKFSLWKESMIDTLV
jgi:hypothetical protein